MTTRRQLEVNQRAEQTRSDRSGRRLVGGREFDLSRAFPLAGASTGARATAADVKALADALSIEAESLQGEVRRFLADVQAA